MKKIFIALAALATIAACNKAEVIGTTQDNLIGFGSPFVDNATKAIDPSYSGEIEFTSFNVWGTVNGGVGTVAIFAGDSVTGSVGENQEWTCATKQYWVNGAKYNFAALANAGKVTLGTDMLPKTVEYNAANKTDLVYAKSKEYTGKESGNELVALTFNHLLSLVNFTVKNGSKDAKGYSFIVKDIKINGATKGTYYIQADGENAAGTWKSTESAGYTIGDITVDNSIESADCGTALLVIPGTVSVSFNVDICCDSIKIGTKAYSKTNITLAAGNSYNFIVEPKVGEEIKFNVASDPTWTSNTDITIQ